MKLKDMPTVVKYEAEIHSHLQLTQHLRMPTHAGGSANKLKRTQAQVPPRRHVRQQLLFMAAVVTIARCCLCCYQGAGRVWPCVCRWMRKIEAAQATETEASNRYQGKSRYVSCLLVLANAPRLVHCYVRLRVHIIGNARTDYGNRPYIYLQRNQSFNGIMQSRFAQSARCIIRSERSVYFCCLM